MMSFQMTDETSPKCFTLQVLNLNKWVFFFQNVILFFNVDPRNYNIPAWN